MCVCKYLTAIFSVGFQLQLLTDRWEVQQVDGVDRLTFVCGALESKSLKMLLLELFWEGSFVCFLVSDSLGSLH